MSLERSWKSWKLRQYNKFNSVMSIRLFWFKQYHLRKFKKFKLLQLLQFIHVIHFYSLQYMLVFKEINHKYIYNNVWLLIVHVFMRTKVLFEPKNLVQYCYKIWVSRYSGHLIMRLDQTSECLFNLHSDKKKLCTLTFV